MEFKTIAVHLDHAPSCEGRVEVAARLACAHGSHLVGVLPTGLPVGAPVALPLEWEEDAPGFDSEADYIELRAQAIGHVFDTLIRRYGPPSHEFRKAGGSPIDALVGSARASDLMIIGCADADAGERGRHPAMTARELADQMVMHAGRPVLSVPAAGAFRTLGERVLVAWDSSRESALALRDALPLLRKASAVVLATLCESGPFAQPQLHGREVIEWLARHEVRAELEQYHAAGGIPDGLRSCATLMDADLIVMGGYAHGSLRERLLGGVSRDMLSQMQVPVLMSH